MREYEVVFDKGLLAGLRTSERNRRNQQALVKSQGMYPEEGALRSVDVPTLLSGIEALGESFPYPQVFYGQSHIVVAGATKIWEYKDGVYTLKLSGLIEGTLWSMADFFDFIIMANGQQIIRRETETHLWEVVDEETLPVSNCVAAVNGQLIVGSPQEVY